MDKVARDYRYVKLQVKSYFDWKAPVPVKPMSPSKEVDERGKEPSAPPLLCFAADGAVCPRLAVILVPLFVPKEVFYGGIRGIYGP